MPERRNKSSNNEQSGKAHNREMAIFLSDFHFWQYFIHSSSRISSSSNKSIGDKAGQGDRIKWYDQTRKGSLYSLHMLLLCRYFACTICNKERNFSFVPQLNACSLCSHKAVAKALLHRNKFHKVLLPDTAQCSWKESDEIPGIRIPSISFYTIIEIPSKLCCFTWHNKHKKPDFMFAPFKKANNTRSAWPIAMSFEPVVIKARCLWPGSLSLKSIIASLLGRAKWQM